MSRRTTRRAARATVGAALLGLTAGCGGSAADDGPPTVSVQTADQQIVLQPTQFCFGDEGGERYDIVPPVVDVSPDTAITLRVPSEVADSGWSVQVYDDQLATKIGEVDVGADTEVFSEINSSDVSPPGFYLVVVQDAGEDCNGLSGAWPVGFIRAGGAISDTTAPATPAPAG
ncbi:DUF2771 family protein [Modestobacter sp. I12A-02628]|uniref:DUF2771 family protein n=1 Tax=Goekera deserti TaxID=2497753 RepID=A0A7K3WJ19_9ACTN|nr:DUF2771 family protein [Goekera deserti]MPQ99305.1 DUF2771 family protein [Goekera deserti]NDI50304.1 DUF2771 family protein [Goekera deserti]NEL56444.1 DUF2771 family protein [Goekera deserti]